uniref:Cell wall protein TIR4-like n=1 Tax=Petromyzon marinus TaxID=7757 RepID=A0AAJ7UAE2_PETMA|nr:cell wall protein TIR4-like [Petromyzon marinus]
MISAITSYVLGLTTSLISSSSETPSYGAVVETSSGTNSVSLSSTVSSGLVNVSSMTSCESTSFGSRISVVSASEIGFAIVVILSIASCSGAFDGVSIIFSRSASLVDHATSIFSRSPETPSYGEAIGFSISMVCAIASCALASSGVLPICSKSASMIPVSTGTTSTSCKTSLYGAVVETSSDTNCISLSRTASSLVVTVASLTPSERSSFESIIAIMSSSQHGCSGSVVSPIAFCSKSPSCVSMTSAISSYVLGLTTSSISSSCKTPSYGAVVETPSGNNSDSFSSTVSSGIVNISSMTTCESPSFASRISAVSSSEIGCSIVVILSITSCSGAFDGVSIIFSRSASLVDHATSIFSRYYLNVF